jgi:hypothetical protein
MVYKALTEEEKQAHRPSYCQVIIVCGREGESHGVLDHSLQTVVATGSEQECLKYCCQL